MKRVLLLSLLLSISSIGAAADEAWPASVSAAMALDSRADRIDALRAALKGADQGQADAVALHLAEQVRLNGASEDARGMFKSLRKSAHESAAELGLALCELALGKNRLSTLMAISPSKILPTQNADRYAILAADAKRNADPELAKRYAEMALNYAENDLGVQRRLQPSMEALITGDTGGDSADLSIEAKIDAAVESGDLATVQALVRSVTSDANASDRARGVAKYAERRIATTVDPTKIAVLLPLSGKYRGVGAMLQRAIELGFGPSGANRSLIFIDTGDTEESARAAMEQAVFTEGAVAIIGPVRTEYASPLSEIAEATRTPLVGLFQSRPDVIDRQWSIDGLATTQSQASALVKHVMEVEGMKNFAIFAPDSAYGAVAADAFQADVEARGGSIVVREAYDNTATDLIPFAQKLGRKDYEARADEWRKVKKAIAEAGGDPGRAVLPPVIDFDAIFVPDKARRLPVAAAGLAYEEFPVGDFQVRKGEPTIPLLGLSGWNSAELVTTGGPYVRSSRFVDVFLPKDQDVVDFITAYRESTGRIPNTLEAQAYSAGAFASIASRSEANTRRAFLSALENAKLPAQTPTGASSLSGNNLEIQHNIRILTLDKDGIHEVDPPEKPAPE